MKTIKLYDVHGHSAIEKYPTLITPDNRFFYWDSKAFTYNSVGDVVFWVNRAEKEALYTIIDSVNIQPSFRNGKNLIKDSGYHVSAKATDAERYGKFYRFKIIEKASIPWEWNYLTPGTFNSRNMNIILYRPKINDTGKRIEKINDLKSLFHHSEAVTHLLNEAMTALEGKESPGKALNVTPPVITMRPSNILTAIKTKPFILLAGISGTGKSRLVRTLAFKTCSHPELRGDPKKPGNFELIPVRPNWHDSSELIGYISRINGEKYVTTTFLQFIAKAWRYPKVPFFLCLDEMNLAPAEQYFAEYLSVLETRQKQGDHIVSDYIISRTGFENEALYRQLLNDLALNDHLFSEGIGIPPNLVVMGTVNIDETAYAFSRKILDRAMTIEMYHIDLNEGLDKSPEDWGYPKEYFIPQKYVAGEYTSGAQVVAATFAAYALVIRFLQHINQALDGTPFKIAYRVRDEFLIYCYHASQSAKNTGWLTPALDQMTMMKILPRIEGDESKTADAIDKLLPVLTSHPQSHRKLLEMKNRLQLFGYTSFWP